MYRSIRILFPIAAALCALASSAFAADAKHVWVVPINVSQALKIKVETKADDALLKKVAEQCLDADCQKQLAACKAAMATCVLMPSKESVHESEMENN